EAKEAAITSTPDDHFATSPYGCVPLSRGRCVAGAGGCPTVRARIVSPAGVQIVAATPSTPHYHFAAGPHCRVLPSGNGRVSRGGSYPVIDTATRGTTYYRECIVKLPRHCYNRHRTKLGGSQRYKAPGLVLGRHISDETLC